MTAARAATRNDDRGGGESRPLAPLLARISTRALLVTPIRVLGGLALLAAARAAGAEPDAAGGAFLLGALGLVVAAFLDPRSRFLGSPGGAAPAPSDARFATRLELVREGLLPSSVGVALLTAVALPFEQTLAALLAGVLAGLGVASALSAFRVIQWERVHGLRLYDAGEQLFVAGDGELLTPR